MPRNRVLPCLAGLVLVAAVFCRVLGYSFVAIDDNENVYNNPHLQPVTPSEIGYFWSHGYNGLYMPLTSTVWALTAAATHLPRPRETPTGTYSSANPAAFHGLNLILHLANVALIYLLLSRLLRLPRLRGRRTDNAIGWCCAFGSLLFGLHPVQAEAVSWVTGLNNVLAGFWSLLALYYYTRFARLRQLGSDAGAEGSASLRRAGTISYVAATACFALALLAKPITATLPLMAWAIDFWLVGRPARRGAAAVTPWLVLGVGCALLAWAVVGQGNRTVYLPPWGRPFIAGDALCFYLAKLAWPAHLTINYGRTPAVVLAMPISFVAWIIPVAAGLWLWNGRERTPVGIASAAIFVAGLLPVLGFVPFYSYRYSTTGDRYLYLSLLGPALALSWLLGLPSWRWLRYLAPPIVAIWALLCVQTSENWRDSVRLLEGALAINPNTVIMQTDLGVVYVARRRPDLALPHYQEALRRDQTTTALFLNLAGAYRLLGQPKNAEATYARALKSCDDVAAVEVDWAALRLDAGDFAGARRHALAALRVDSRRNLAIDILGRADLRAGRFNAARQEFQAAVAIEPRDGDAHTQLAFLDLQAKQDREAFAHLAAAIQNGTDSANTHYLMAELLARHGQTGRAADELAEALRDDPDYPDALAMQGLMLAQAGQTARAMSSLKRAVAIWTARPYLDATNIKQLVEARYNLGGTLYVLRDVNGALRQWRLAVKESPAFAPARQAIAKMTPLIK